MGENASTSINVRELYMIQSEIKYVVYTCFRARTYHINSVIISALLQLQRRTDKSLFPIYQLSTPTYPSVMISGKPEN